MYRFFVHHVLNATRKNLREMAKMNGVNGHSYSQNSFDLEVNRIVWVDMEMTGLDIEKDKIMEVACLVTDSDLNVLAEGPDIIIHQPEELLNNMDEWCINQHGKTGLTQACLKSNVTVQEAEATLLNFVKKYITERHSPLAGNSVYMDRLFLKKFMPTLNDYLHYRIIDVSTIKEVCRRWNPEVYKQVPKKEYSHRALQDIKESVEELKFYKTHFFKSSEVNSLDIVACRIVWMDLEFTGLDIEKDKIMEIACLVTDSDLNIIAEGPNIVIGHSGDVLQNMNEWCVHHHKKTGLTEACLESNTTIEEAEASLLDFLRQLKTH